MTHEELLEAAAEAATRSYSPYSSFRVGAAVLAADGTVYTGANVENAAYGSAVCAEASAISAAVNAGVRKIDTVAAVCLDGEFCSPCGNCRQIMQEFFVETVLMHGPDGTLNVLPLSELLPLSFGPEALG
jgi:cytidine deaminase